MRRCRKPTSRTWPPTAFTQKNLRNAEVVESMGMLRGRWQAMNHPVLALQGVASDRGGSISAFSKTFRLLA
jgi:ATP-binding cassette subfamily C protein EexD